MNNNQNTFVAVAPQATFQSTSTIQGSGSNYSSNPMLNADGMASYEGATYTETQVPSGPRKIVTPGNSGTQQPIGDALIPLTLMALVYMLFLYRRRVHRKTEE